MQVPDQAVVRNGGIGHFIDRRGGRSPPVQKRSRLGTGLPRIPLSGPVETTSWLCLLQVPQQRQAGTAPAGGCRPSAWSAGCKPAADGLDNGANDLGRTQIAAGVANAEDTLGPAPADVGTGPFQYRGQPVAEPGKESQVDKSPDNPARETGKMYPADAHDGPEPPDGRGDPPRGPGT